MRGTHLIFSKRKKTVFGKKGNAVADTLLIVIVLGVLPFVIIYGKSMVDDITNELTVDNGWSNETVTIANEVNDDYGSLWDGIFIFVFVGLWMASLAFAFLLDSHPIFMIITVLAMVGVFIVAGEIANVYESFVNTDATMDVIATTHFPMTNALLDNWFVVSIIVGFSIVIVLYAKNKLG